MKTVYLCEDSVEAIFTAIYDAWASGKPHEETEVQVSTGDYNQQFFCEYINVNTDIEKATKVARTLKRKISGAFYDTVMIGATSFEVDKGDVIYRCIIHGLQYGPEVMDHLTIDAVHSLMAMERNAYRELNHFQGFLRFVELRNGILLGKFQPKNNLLPFLAPHFEDRFPDENFIIADTGRKTVVLHGKNHPMAYTIMEDIDFDKLEGDLSDGEILLQKLFTHYTHSIAIESRYNPKLQQQMLPLRFRKNMTEFQTAL